MSRERAQLARERAQLDRMRDEFRQEMERAQRHAGMHESLASVRKLKNEMSERNRAIDAPRRLPTKRTAPPIALAEFPARLGEWVNGQAMP